MLKKAKKKAAEEAKKAAEEAVKEALKITELPVGNGKKPKTRYIEEVNITEIVEKMNIRVHPPLMQGVSATGVNIFCCHLRREKGVLYTIFGSDNHLSIQLCILNKCSIVNILLKIKPANKYQICKPYIKV